MTRARSTSNTRGYLVLGGKQRSQTNERLRVPLTLMLQEIFKVMVPRVTQSRIMRGSCQSLV